MPPIEVKGDYEGLPLNTHLTIRVTKAHWVNLCTQAVANNVGHTNLARHWMLKGALADGIDLESFL